MPAPRGAQNCRAAAVQLALAVLLAAAAGTAALPPNGGFSLDGPFYGALCPGVASVTTATELLRALEDNTGEIILAGAVWGRGGAAAKGTVCRLACPLPLPLNAFLT